jgi:glycerol-3-phosphate dehydrogenase
VDRETLSLLIRKAAEMVPALRGMPVTALYAGLRPATEKKEYRVAADAERRMIRVGGIRSTGLTAALGLAAHVAALYRGFGDAALPPLAEPGVPSMPNLAEHLPRDWQSEGNGGIVCHCELVTRREIEAALEGAVPAGDAGGLKRRTRAGMGRCQGFYCQARIAALTQGRLRHAIDAGHLHG